MSVPTKWVSRQIFALFQPVPGLHLQRMKGPGSGSGEPVQSYDAFGRSQAGDKNMTKILAISGSLRAKSYNTALLRAAQMLAAPDTTLDIATLHGIPLYDGDVEEREGVPQIVNDLKARIRASDGLLLATPEYNNGIPGVFKNAIDWLSRPPADIPKIFANRPVAVIGASPGGFGTILAQTSWHAVLRTLGTRHWSGGRLLVSRANHVFDENGSITDETVRKQLQDFLRGYAQFIYLNPLP